MKIVRNLIMHIWPTRNGAWQFNVAQLLRRIDQFNGQRIVSVVTDANTNTLEEVKAAFKGTVTDFLHFPNDPKLGETVSFEKLLLRIENIDPRAISYYCHAKGSKYTSSDEQPQVKPWIETMHGSLLDYPDLVDDSLKTHAMVGAFRRTGRCFARGEPSSHYAGTFFWFKNDKVFNDTSWQRIPREWWAVEAWPGLLFQDHDLDYFLMSGQGPSMDGTGSAMKMYSKKFWRDEAGPVWKAWQIKHAQHRRAQRYSEVLNSLSAEDERRIVVSGPQRSGTMIASKMLAHDLGLTHLDECEFDTHNFYKFYCELIRRPDFVIHAPAMSRHLDVLPKCSVVWMRRNLSDILRSQNRIGWEEHGPYHGLPERDKYFDHSQEPVASIKTRAWEKFQRISLGSKAFDLDYESLSNHPMWIDKDDRKDFKERQTGKAEWCS